VRDECRIPHKESKFAILFLFRIALTFKRILNSSWILHFLRLFSLRIHKFKSFFDYKNSPQQIPSIVVCRRVNRHTKHIQCSQFAFKIQSLSIQSYDRHTKHIQCLYIFFDRVHFNSKLFQKGSYPCKFSL
jgi:hypothetical protein